MLDFSMKPEITREFLLSKANQETYMSYYLGIPVKKGLFKNPLRNDSHVTCSFFTGRTGILYFKDFATGECMSFEKVVMKKFGCNYHQALNIIAKDFGYIKSSVKPKSIQIQPTFKQDKITMIQVEIKDFTPAELKWWNSYGITQQTLNKFKVYSCNTVFLNTQIIAQSAQHSPIYGYYFGKKSNLEQWRIYFPKRKDFRFIGNCSANMIQGFKQLPKSGKLLVITKSMKDVMCLYAYGIPAIAPNSENLFIDDSTLDELRARFKYIIVFYDNDLPGIINMNKIHKQHPDLHYYWIPRKYEAKDISDFRQKYGEDKTREFIRNALTILKNEKRT